jgi:ADP-ribose pyrophosphatase YjhB (NUDIX family)
MSQRIAVRGIVLDEDGGLFCVKLKAYDGKPARKFWVIPGGGVTDQESLEAALHREMIEETGIAPVIGNLLYVQQYSFEGNEQLEFFFHITNTADYKNIDISTASHAAEEIDQFGFVDPETTHILPEFLTTEPIGSHISANGPTKIFTYL